jgi:hypothetical protein
MEATIPHLKLEYFNTATRMTEDADDWPENDGESAFSDRNLLHSNIEGVTLKFLQLFFGRFDCVSPTIVKAG